MVLQLFNTKCATELSAKLVTGYSGFIHTHISSTGIDNGQSFVVIAEEIMRAIGAYTADRSVVVEPAKTL